MDKRVVLLLVIAGCSSAKEQPPGPRPVVPVTPAPAAADAGSVADESKVGPPPPAFAEVARLRIEIDQGGPAMMVCKGRVLEAAIDLEAGTWKRGACQGKKPGTLGEQGAPLTFVSGKLDQETRKKLEAAYALLKPIPSYGGNDGGAVRLFVTRRDPASKQEEPEQRWVDLNWHGEVPPPPALEKLRAFATVLASIQP